MSVTTLTGIQVPPAVAAWIDRVMLVFLALVVLWLVLKVVGFAYRRSYNLTPVATARSKDIRPDFLEVDHKKQKELLERGAEFGRAAPPGLATAERAASVGVLVSGLGSFVTTVFFAFGTVQMFDNTWRTISAKDRFVAMVQTHPVGFAIALVMIVTAVAELTMSLRKEK